MGLFGAAYELEGGGGRGREKRPVIPKICYTYPTMTKLVIIIPYLEKNQKTYESRHTILEGCLHQRFFQRKSANFAKLRNTDINCILIHDF